MCMQRIRPVCGLIGGLILVLAGCTLVVAPENNAPAAPPTQAAAPATRPIEARPDGWRTVAPGIEQRTMAVEGALGFDAHLVRLDPAQVAFRVHYSPGTPRSLDDWQAALPQASVIVNAAFFDESGRALGLLVSDGQVTGQSFAGFGGMFQVDASGARVRSLVTEPYQGERLEQAIQAFPMLLEVGGVLAPSGDGFDQRNRRTVIAQDRAGRVIFAVIPYGLVSFSDLQQWLVASDLDLQIAFALDGGRSTGMVVRTPDGETVHPALDRLPSVIAAYPR